MVSIFRYSEISEANAASDSSGATYDLVSCIGATWIGGGLPGTLDRIEAAGLELVEMVLANQDDWDRYQSSQWLAGHEWIAANPDDPDVEEIGRMTAEFRRSYLSGLRSTMGWGVFVLKEA